MLFIEQILFIRTNSDRMDLRVNISNNDSVIIIPEIIGRTKDIVDFFLILIMCILAISSLPGESLSSSSESYDIMY